MKRLFFLIALFLAIQAHAQENTEGQCNDGIDNDGDGFIDCYDNECYAKAACKDFFLGKDVACDAKPDSFPPFGMRLKFKSNKGTNHVNRLIAGDVDSDGVPEVVTTYRNSNNASSSFINVFQAPTSGSLLNLEKQIDLLADGFSSDYADIAMADINGDGCAEYFILTTTTDGNNYRIIAYNCSGVKIWANPIVYSFYPGTMGLADFDGDGFVELYTRTQIFDAHSGALMGQNNIDGVNSNSNWGKNSNAPIAVDIISSSPGLELIAGCRIYTVSISRPAAPPALPPATSSITLFKERTEYFTRTSRTTGSGTSVADFNQDGHLDIIAVGSLNDYDKTTTIFFWDVFKDVIKTYTDVSGSGDYYNGWKNGAGRVNLADIDGDTLMNAVYVSGKYLYALKETPTALDTLWRRRVTEETSGYTGCTMFDFNGDGKSEIVYRDEENLYIYTTTNTAGVITVTRSIGQACKSRTSNEYPIVVDMDADGHSEICVTCAVDETTLGKDHGLYDDAEIRVFESSDDNAPWVPSRRLWNQHGYFIVNVNDDLTIPKHQQLSEKVFSTDKCPNRKGKNRPFNSFLNQAPFLNSLGCPQYAAPNLTYSAGTLKVNAPTCPDKDFTVSFQMKNLGNLALVGSVPISFYDKNPLKPGAKKFNTVYVTLNLSPTDSVLSGSLTVKGTGAPDSLYIVMNDAGTTPGVSPIVLPNTKFIECDYDNVIATYVKPKPVPIIPTATEDIQCPGSTTPHNGTVSAKILINGVDQSNKFNFYWTDGSPAKPLPSDYTGALYIKREGSKEYTVFAVHKTVSCGSDTSKITVPLKVPPPLVVDVLQVHADDNCNTPNGVLTAVVNDPNHNGTGGDPASKFSFEWYEGATPGSSAIISIADTAQILKPTYYNVLVTDKATGCLGGAGNNVIDARPILKVTTVAKSIDCSLAAIGSVTSTLTVNGTTAGSTSGYIYNWFNGAFVKPTNDYPADVSHNVLSNLSANDYTLFVFDKTSKCYSDTITTKVTKTVQPIIVSVLPTMMQVSCNPLVNTGAAEVTVDDVTKYNFQWYEGQGLSVPISGEVNPKTVTGLKKGIYTVLVTDKVTKCATTGEVTIDQDNTPLTVSPLPKANSSCAPKTGEIKIALSKGLAADYTYFLDDGITIKQQVGDSVFSSLDAKTYNVWAINNTTTCQTDVKPVKVTNSIPVISTTPSNIPAADCKNKIGTLSVSASGGGNNFIFEWYKGGDTSGSPIAGATGTATSSSLVTKYGNYTVKITDVASGCITEKQQFLPIANSHVLSLTKTDIDKCFPVLGGEIDATLTITTTAPGFTYTQADYSILVYAGSDDPDPDIDNPNGATPFSSSTGSGPLVTNTYPLTPFNDEFYTVVAVSNLVGSPTEKCRVSSTVKLNRITTNPIINDDFVNNSSCDLLNPNGTAQLHLGGNPDTAPADLDPTNYTITWNDGTSDLAAFADKDFANNLKSGNYTVTATLKPTEVNGNCKSSKIISILDVPQLISLSTDTTDLTNCVPATGLAKTEGQATVTQVKADGVIDLLTNYTYTWTADNGTPVPVSGIGQAGPLAADNYNVIAVNNLTKCKQNASFTIEDQTINSIGIDLVNFIPQISCIDPQDSELEIQVTGITNLSGYDYAWYKGDKSTVDFTKPSEFPVTTTLTGTLMNEIRTVKVINKDNNCWAVESYTMTGKSNPIRIDASSSPLITCYNEVLGIKQNGALYATVILPTKHADGVTQITDNDFDFVWYINAVQQTLSPFLSNSVNNLTDTLVRGKTIKVKAIEKAGSKCVSDTITLRVLDDRIQPVVTAEAISPASNCDLTIPNGIAAANVGGDNTHYLFDWFEGTPVDPKTSAGFYQGPMAADLKPKVAPDNIIYTVLGTDIVTGCTNTTTVTLQFVPLKPHSPQVDVLSDVTNCDPDNPNGSLTAAVDGNMIDYTFSWTKVGDASFAERKDSVTIHGLNIGTYKVVAVDNYSKCSADTTGVIGIHQVVPEFGITEVDASCAEDDGFAAIYIINSDPITIDKIEWTDLQSGLIVATGNVVSEIIAGSYNVKVTTDRGCVSDKDFVVNTNIHPHNGISRNGDGKNEYFHIDCIDNFPGNVVRVYNRIGTLVYEATDYNNLDVVFDGKSNKGVSVLGTNLPDGTYFYIVDKHNGSKQLAGYLEIVN